MTLTEAMQEDIISVVRLLEEDGVQLSFPFSSGIEGSRHSHMRELRVQSKTNPIRILYAFDPRRNTILLIGGTKSMCPSQTNCMMSILMILGRRDYDERTSLF
jgi:hypothetical protein